MVEGKLNKDADKFDQWLWDALIQASKMGETETVKMFCDAGALVDRRQGYDERTALHIAIEKGHLSIAEYLIKEAKADVNIADKNNNTALHLAIEFGQIDTVKMLCEARAQVDRKDRLNERTALHIAIEKGHLSTVEYLIKEAKADVNVADKDNNTALHLAAKKGRTDIVHLILMCANGVNVYTKGDNGRTVLHWECQSGHLSTVRFLVGRGASFNEQDDYGWTPLHDASRNGHVSIVSLLLRNGADAAIKSNKGETARAFAGRAFGVTGEKRREIKLFWDQYSSGQ